MGSWRNEIGTGDEFGVAASLGLGASFCRIESSTTSTSDSTSSTPIASSNIGFQLLKKHGWKEGTGLGVSEQGRLEPVEALVKKNKRGLGADRDIKKKDKSKKVEDQSEPDEKRCSFPVFVYCLLGDRYTPFCKTLKISLIDSELPFDGDEEYNEALAVAHESAAAKVSENENDELKKLLEFHEQGDEDRKSGDDETDDDDDFSGSFFKPMGSPSPGSIVGSATSNDAYYK